MMNESKHISSLNGHIPKKSFGQNFLQDNCIINEIIHGFSSKINEDDIVVEIGPGLGALTRLLVNKFNHIHAIELDRVLATNIQKEYSNITVHQQDVLKFNFQELYASNNTHTTDNVVKKLNIIGNLPYNISSPLLLNLIDYCDIVNIQYFMLQKEVIDRLVAVPKTKSYGRLSIILQAHYVMKKVLHVPPQAFIPQPKVDSAVVYMVPQKLVNIEQSQALQYISKICFSQRRKMLRGFVEHKDMFVLYGFDLNRRAEEVPVIEYIELAKWWVNNKNYD